MSYRRQLSVVALVALVALGALAQPRSPAAPPPAPAGAPSLELVPADAAAFVHFRVDDLWDSPLANQIRSTFPKEVGRLLDDSARDFGFPFANVATITYVMSTVDLTNSKGLIIVTTRTPFDKASLLKANRAGERVTNVAGLEMYQVRGREHLVVLDDRTFVDVTDNSPDAAAATAEVQRLTQAAQRASAGPLRSALDRAAGKAIAGGLNMKAVPLPPQFTPPPPLEALAPLLKANVAAFTFDPFGPQLTLAVRADFPTAGEADAGQKAARDGVKLLAEFLGQYTGRPARPGPDGALVKQLLQDGQSAAAKAEITRENAAVTVTAKMTALTGRGGEIAAAIAETGRKAEAAAEQAREANNLKQIALAVHIHASKNNRLPGHAIYSADGKTPLLSWRVAILPYVEQKALFNEFKTDEPWDSEHNKKLIPLIPKTYVSKVPAKQHGWTYYRVFVGGGSLFDQAAQGPRFADVTDGLSNTVMAVEAAESVPWTKPDELVFDPKQPLPKLGADPKADRFLAAFGDGSVRSLSKNLAEATLKALITRAGGEPIDRRELDK